MHGLKTHTAVGAAEARELWDPQFHQAHLAELQWRDSATRGDSCDLSSWQLKVLTLPGELEAGHTGEECCHTDVVEPVWPAPPVCGKISASKVRVVAGARGDSRQGFLSALPESGQTDGQG